MWDPSTVPQAAWICEHFVSEYPDSLALSLWCSQGCTRRFLEGVSPAQRERPAGICSVRTAAR